MKAELEALAVRCEAATGPDRELDALINDIAGRRPTMPAYTASLDAAMTLVPEGYLYGIGNPEGAAHAVVSESPDALIDPVKAATPALALCAASLRALATPPKGTGQ